MNKKKQSRKSFKTIASKGLNCFFCKNKNGRYECSRCHNRYCSIECFRSSLHRECSENFYKKMCIDYLKNMPSSDDKNEFVKILKRNEENLVDYLDVLNYDNDNDDGGDGSDDDDYFENNDRMNRFMKYLMSNYSNDDDGDCLWNKLNEDDRNEFIEIVDMNLNFFKNIIYSNKWTPWWCRNDWCKAVLNDDDNNDNNNNKSYPSNRLLLKHVKPLSKLLSSQKSPSPLLINIIISLSISYCYLCRLYNGELNDNDNDNDELWEWSIIDKLYRLVPELQSNYVAVAENFNDYLTIINVLIERLLTIDDDDKSSSIVDQMNERKKFIIQLLNDLMIIIDWNHPGRYLLINANDNDNDNNNNNQYKTSKAIILILSDLYRIINNINHHHHHHHHDGKEIKLLMKKFQFYTSYIIEFCDKQLKDPEKWIDSIEFHKQRLQQQNI